MLFLYFRMRNIYLPIKSTVFKWFQYKSLLSIRAKLFLNPMSKDASDTLLNLYHGTFNSGRLACELRFSEEWSVDWKEIQNLKSFKPDFGDKARSLINRCIKKDPLLNKDIAVQRSYASIIMVRIGYPEESKISLQNIRFFRANNNLFQFFIHGIKFFRQIIYLIV